MTRIYINYTYTVNCAHSMGARLAVPFPVLPGVIPPAARMAAADLRGQFLIRRRIKRVREAPAHTGDELGEVDLTP